MKNSSKPTLLQWRYFVYSVQHGSLLSASFALNVDVSILSTKIRELEVSLGVDLLIRTKAGVRPTWLGVKAYNKALAFISKFDETMASLQMFESHEAIRMAVPQSLCPLILKWIGKFQKFSAHKAAKIVVDSYNDNTQPDFWSYDFVLVSGEPPHERLTARPLGSYERILCAHPSFKEMSDKLDSPEQLLNSNLITVNLATEIFSRNQQAISIRIKPVIRVAEIQSLIDSAESKLGISVGVPTWMVLEKLQQGQLIQILSEWKISCVPVWVLRKPSKKINPLPSQLMTFFEIEWKNTPGLLSSIDKKVEIFAH